MGYRPGDHIRAGKGCLGSQMGYNSLGSTDEQFLNVLHSIEEITDATPLREVAKQLPKQIYNVIQSQEQIRISAELTDQLVFDVVKTYYYSVIESLCKLIKSIQEGQRTALVSLAKIVQDQRDEIERYQTLLELPEEIRQLQWEMEKLKKRGYTSRKNR